MVLTNTTGVLVLGVWVALVLVQGVAAVAELCRSGPGPADRTTEEMR